MTGTGATIPVEAVVRFTAAEGRLYPMAVSDPAGYETATTLVGLAADELRRSSADVAAVLAHREELIELLPGLAGEAGLETGGLDLGTLVDAASALRCRELGGTVGPATSGP
jgi:hypothetical protein